MDTIWPVADFKMTEIFQYHYDTYMCIREIIKKKYDNCCNKNLFLPAGHKVDFIARRGEKNPFLDPLVEKKSCSTRKNINLNAYSRFDPASNYTLAK